MASRLSIMESFSWAFPSPALHIIGVVPTNNSFNYGANSFLGKGLVN